MDISIATYAQKLTQLQKNEWGATHRNALDLMVNHAKARPQNGFSNKTNKNRLYYKSEKSL